MPIFEFKCKKCGHTFETIAHADEDGSNLVCLVCGAPCPEKQLSLFSASGSDSGMSGGGCGPTGGFS
jgi:putative FmdB family regulatory protein